MKKLLLLLAVVALSAFGLAACGGDDDDDGGETTAAATTTTDTGAATGGGGGAGGTVQISAAADGSLAYDQTEVSAPAGPVTIDFDNPASLSHDVAVEDSSGQELGKTDLISREPDVDDGRPASRQLHVLLHRPGPPRGRHGGHARRAIAGGARCTEAARRPRAVSVQAGSAARPRSGR